MQLDARRWIATGAVLAGVSVIAVTPVPPAVTDIQVRAVHLTAGFDPVAAWTDVFQTAATNTTDIFDHFSAAPFPALQQEVVNRLGFLQHVVNNPADIAKVLGQFQDKVMTAADAHFIPFVPEGGATDSLYGSLDTEHADFLAVLQQYGIPALADGEGLQAQLQSMVTFAASPMAGILWGDIGATLSPALQYGDDVADIIAALGAADLMTALQEVVDMPANITGAALNGYGPVDLVPLLDQLGITLPSLDLVPGVNTTVTSLPLYFGGLLSPGGSFLQALGLSADATLDDGSTAPLDLYQGEPVGPFASLLTIQQGIAAALGWDGVGNPLAGLFDAATGAGSSVTDVAAGVADLWAGLL